MKLLIALMVCVLYLPAIVAENNTNQSQSCDFAVELLQDTAVYESAQPINFQIRAFNVFGNKTNISAEIAIRDAQQNIVKTYKPFTHKEITTKKTSSKYTPNLPIGAGYVILANVSTECEDTNATNNNLKMPIIIHGIQTDNTSVAAQPFLAFGDFLDIGSDKIAKFGQALRVNVQAQRGTSNKELVEVWVQNKNGEKISATSKISVKNDDLQNLNVPILLDANCDQEHDAGIYTVIAEGLDTQAEKNLRIDGLTKSNCQIVTKIVESAPNITAESQKWDYSLVWYDALPKDLLRAVVHIQNDDQQSKLEYWSYVFRGSKVYSESRMPNKKSTTVESNQHTTLIFENNVSNLQPGNYSFKIQINKNGQKTNYGLTKPITIEKKSAEISTPAKNSIKPPPKEFVIESKDPPNSITGAVIYESNTQALATQLPVGILLVSILLSVAIVWGKL